MRLVGKAYFVVTDIRHIMYVIILSRRQPIFYTLFKNVSSGKAMAHFGLENKVFLNFASSILMLLPLLVNDQLEHF